MTEKLTENTSSKWGKKEILHPGRTGKKALFERLANWVIPGDLDHNISATATFFGVSERTVRKAIKWSKEQK